MRLAAITDAKASKVATGAVWVLLNRSASLALAFFGQVALSRILEPLDFGLFAKAMALTDFVFLFWAFNFPTLLIALQDRSEIENVVTTMAAAVAGLFFLAGMALSAVLGRFYPYEILLLFRTLCAIRALEVVPAVLGAIALRQLKWRQWAVVRAVATMISVVAMIGFGLMGLGAWSLVVGQLLSLLGTLLGYLVITDWHYRPKVRGDTLRDVARFGSRMFLAQTLENLLHRADRMVLALTVSTSALGYYDRAQYLLMIMCGFITDVTWNVGLPLYAGLGTDTRGVQRVFDLSNFVLIRAVLGVAILFAVTPEVIVGIIYGSNWLPVAPVIRCLAIGLLAYVFRENAKYLLTSAGMIGRVAMVKAVQVLAYLVLLVVSIITWGILGAAAALSCGLVIEAAGLMYYARRLVTVCWGRDIALPLLIGAAAAGAGIVATSVLGNKFLGAAGMLALYAGLLVVSARGQVPQVLMPGKKSLEAR